MSKCSRRRALHCQFADLYGRPHEASYCSYGLTGRAFFDDLTAEPSDDVPEISEAELSEEIWVPVLKAYNEWAQSGQLTHTQLRTVHALLLEDLGLRQHSRNENVSQAAISSRIVGLDQKAAKFHRWWTSKYPKRRQAAGNRGAALKEQRRRDVAREKIRLR